MRQHPLRRTGLCLDCILSYEMVVTDQNQDDEGEALVVMERERHDGPVCPSCFSPIEDYFDYCPNCDVPLSQFSTADPLKTIRSEGEMFRRGVKGPSLLVVIGMWLIFLPGLLIAFMVLGEVGNSRIYVTAAVGIMFWFYGSILFKVTSRYLKAKQRVRKR